MIKTVSGGYYLSFLLWSRSNIRAARSVASSLFVPEGRHTRCCRPHQIFLFNSLHTIGVLMQEDVDAASHLLVCLGELLRMALERRENEITLQSELEFVGKYLEIEQTLS